MTHSSEHGAPQQWCKDSRGTPGKAYFDNLYAHRLSQTRPSVDEALLRTLAGFVFARSPGRSLLDIGCGQGHFVRAAERFFVTRAFDASTYAIRNFADPRVQRWVGSATQVAVRDGIFDAITCIDTLEHLTEPVQCIRECYRVLKPGGVLFFRTPNPRSIGRKLKGSKWFALQDSTHVSIADGAKWTVWTSNTGFDVWEIGTDFLADPPYLTTRHNLAEKLTFQGVSFVLAIVKPYQRWSGGENFYVLARKPTTERPKRWDQEGVRAVQTR